MLQPGKLHQKEEKRKIKPLKERSYHNPSDCLTDEEDGYTDEVKKQIEKELLSADPSKSLKLSDILKVKKKVRKAG